jgi:hypothetical protein
MAKRSVLILLASTVLSLPACKPDVKQQKAAEEAKWRADQKAKAVKNYQEIVSKYPDSPFAEKAKERIRALGPAATPPKK